eukprot:SAG22_NODE_595_length_8730_cov_4.200672_1_plen_47_part_00
MAQVFLMLAFLFVPFDPPAKGWFLLEGTPGAWRSRDSLRTLLGQTF